MGTPREPKPAKYFVALLSSDSEFLTTVESDLAAILGVVDSRSEILPWTASNFYQREMGAICGAASSRSKRWSLRVNWRGSNC